MKYFFIASLLLLLAGTEARAGKKLITASCQMGQGCSFQLSDSEPSDFDVVYGTDAGYHEGLPENAIVVDAKINGQWEHYIETGMGRSELDKFFGGDGFTQLSVFNPYFQPLDGEWKAEIGMVSGDICYGQSSNLFKAMLQGVTAKGALRFPRPFHARMLLNSPEVKWTRQRPDKYSGYLGNEYMNMRFTVQLMSDKLLQGAFVVTIKVPTKPACINHIPVTYTFIRRLGEDPGFTEDPKPDVPILEDPPGPDVPILEDGPKPDVPIIKDPPKPHVPLIKDNPKPNVPLIESGNKPNVPLIRD